MQLSNKERKYRNKIMCENHLKKDAQKYIDSYVAENNTYKNLYLNSSLLHDILLLYRLSKVGDALKDFGMSCAQATNAVRKFATSLDKREF